MTEQQLQRARDLRAQGLSLRAIGRKLGLSHVQVRRWLGPSPVPPQHPPETVREVRERFAAGEQIIDISRQLQIPHGTVCDWVWGRTRRADGGPMIMRPRKIRAAACARLCCHWGPDGCTVGFPPDDWSPRYCGAFSPRQLLPAAT